MKSTLIKNRIEYVLNIIEDLINFNLPEDIYLKLKESFPTAFDENNPARMLEVYIIHNALNSEIRMDMSDDLVEILCSYPHSPRDLKHSAEELIEIATNNLPGEIIDWG